MSQESSREGVAISGLFWTRKEFMKSRRFCQGKEIIFCSGLLRTIKSCTLEKYQKEKKEVPENINRTYTLCAEAGAKHFILKCSS